ncbi:MAG: ABC transporter ATP-binding protein [Thermoanaerobaculia bacterium]|nr:ABC transporter ATP-binding protein [Thermoanaerobaculia bacterium]
MIELHGVERHYPIGDTVVRALRGVDLEVAKGEYLAIMGASGSGKSTLMNMLGCLDTPTKGEYRLDGIGVHELDDDALADVRNRRIGFVFQSFHLLPRLDALGNVGLPLVYRDVPREKRNEAANRALETVGLAERARHRPSEMSGGQMQRVAIARALVSDPAILLADEPTGNLDSTTSAEIMALFDRLHQAGRTVVLVTHEDDIAAHAKRRIRLHDGHVVEDVRN